MVPLLRQVRQRLQPDRLLGRRPPDPEDGKNLNVGAKLKMSRSHLARLDSWWLRLSNMGWLRYSCGEAAEGIMEYALIFLMSIWNKQQTSYS